MTYLVSYGKLQERFLYLSGIRNPLLQGRRICHDYQLAFLMVKDLSYGRSPLDSQSGLIVAPFKVLSRIRQKEDLVTLYKCIEVGGTILGTFLVRKDDKLYAVMVELGYDEASGRKKEPAAEDFRTGRQFFRKCVYGFCTYQHFFEKSVENRLKTLFITDEN